MAPLGIERVDTTLDMPARGDAAEPLPAARLNPPGLGEHGPYRLRFAATRGDLWAVQRLRYEVFNEELGEGLAASAATGRDEDPFDHVCQHLIVEEVATGGVVGTYRMQLADLALRNAAQGASGLGLYSAGEFDLSRLPPADLARAVELGRACVHVDHRHRRVLTLLWQGVTHFGQHHGARSYFGCSSLTSQDEAEGLRFHRWLGEEGYLHPELGVEPLPPFRCSAPPEALVGPAPKVPKLFGTYLRIGAKVLGPPAIDREFGTIDFLTWIELTPEIAANWGHAGVRL